MNKTLTGATPRPGRNEGNKPGSGPDGTCVCAKCGYKQPHTTNKPCNQIKCPKCGAMMSKK